MSTKNACGDYPVSVPRLAGWECCKCGRVYSPFTERCFWCGPQAYTASTTDTVNLSANDLQCNFTFTGADTNRPFSEPPTFKADNQEDKG